MTIKPIDSYLLCVGAINFPNHRGTATSLPIAAFGLSAFFFSTVAGAISNDTDDFLLIVTIGTFFMTCIPGFIMKTTPTTPIYTPLPTSAPRVSLYDSQTAKTKPREGSRRRDASLEPGTRHETTISASSSSSSARSRSNDRLVSGADEAQKRELRLSLDEPIAEDTAPKDDNSDHPHSLFADVRGLSILKYSQCYELFILFGLLTGTGLMTIK